MNVCMWAANSVWSCMSKASTYYAVEVMRGLAAPSFDATDANGQFSREQVFEADWKDGMAFVLPHCKFYIQSP